MKKGGIVSLETRRKISATLKGRIPKNFSMIKGMQKGKSRLDMKGEKNVMWKGDRIGYYGLHSWLVANYGHPNKCEKCGIERASRFEWANINGIYDRNIKNYKGMCPSCHRKMDFGDICKNGHLLSGESVRKYGTQRRCRQCAHDYYKSKKVLV